jgi:flavin-dependent dehydrogenase
MKSHEVIIIGGGPGGSTAAAILARQGVDVAIIERESFPRFHIGESLLPASMVVFKASGFYETLSSGKYIEKYGARFVDHKTDDEIYFGFNDSLNADIPMAFEVERAHFDRDILEHACRSGAKLYQPENVKHVDADLGGVSIETDRDAYRAQYLIDVSGRDSFIGKKHGIRQVNKDLNNVAVFAHYKGVERFAGKDEGDITIGLLPDRGWTWIIPFKGEITSVGVVCTSSLFGAKFNAEKDLGAYLEGRLRSSPRIAKVMAKAGRVSEITTIGNYSHTCDTFFGDRWILAGDAALFLDPIFSSGVHMSVSSSKLAAETILELMPIGQSVKESGLGKKYEDHVRLGASRFRNLIGLFYQGEFVDQMKKTLVRDNMRRGFTSAVAGDVWDENNFLFHRGVL